MTNQVAISLDQLAELAPICLVLIDSRQQLIWGNRAWQDYSGLDGKPRPFCQLTQESERDGLRAALERVFQRPRQLNYEFHCLRHDGVYRVFGLSGTPVMSKNGTPLLVCTLIDLTDEQMVESQMLELNDSLEILVQERTLALQQANQELQQTQNQMFHHEKMASIGQLAAGVAHEINNPMGFIVSNLNTLKKYADKVQRYFQTQDRLIAHLPPDKREQLDAERQRLKIDFLLGDVKELVNESLDGAQRVQDIVRNLKSFSRADLVEEQLADLHQCLEDTITIAWNELKYKATLEKDFGELPPLLCRPQQLNQVFMNLLVNAAHAIADKGLVRVRTRRVGQEIQIDVSDTGCGIPEELQSRIFEPFFTTKEVGKGTGLGLSISYDIVSAHGGQIEVDSSPGQGTTFRVRLPLHKTLNEESPQLEASR